MQILFYRYNSICESDIIDAFQTLGHTIETIDIEITQKDTTPKEQLVLIHTQLQKKHYDFVFSINFYPIISEVCNIYHIHYLSWVVDSPVLELYSHSISNPYNRIFMFDSALVEDFSKYNPNYIFYLPLACNVEKKHILATTNEDSHKYQHTVSFIGSLYSEKNPYSQLRHSSEYMHGYINAIMDTQSKIYGSYIIDELITDEIIDYFKTNLEHLYKFPERSYADYKALIGQYYLGINTTVLERIRLLHRISQVLDTDLYTFSDTASLPYVHCHKGANSTYEMPAIFYNSLINLNLTSRPIRNGISLRVWDVLGCEGFLLTNYQNDLFAHLEVGTHLDVYASEDELIEKAQFYAARPKICKEIAHCGYEYIKENHTYILRCEEMIRMAFSI